MIHIRQAKDADIPRIMEFIDEHWKHGHIMAVSREMFEFQHKSEQEVNYVIAEDSETGKLYGSVGYIVMSMQDGGVISQTMAISLKNDEGRLLAEEMDDFLRGKYTQSISPGLERRYAKFLDIMSDGKCVGTLSHYYRLGGRKKFRIAVITNYQKLPVVYSHDTKFVIIDTFGIFKDKVCLREIKKMNPKRDMRYIKHRYFEHPFYKYKMFGIEKKGVIDSVIVAREQHVEQAKILRIVDYLGNDMQLAECGSCLDKLIERNGYEYIDFYCYGIDSDIMRKAGFSVVKKNDENIIPNYFSPFVKENIEINFFAWDKNNIHVYRGFGDQDRPGKLIK